MIAELARAHLNPSALPVYPTAQLREDVGVRDEIVSMFHIDAWRPLLTAFLFLGDVGPENAPMQYIVGTHRTRAPWKLAKEAEWFAHEQRLARGAPVDDESKYRGCLLPTESRRLIERGGLDVVTCTGSAGTVWMFDKRGLHRATTLEAGRRVLLSVDWVLPSHPFARKAAGAHT